MTSTGNKTNTAPASYLKLIDQLEPEIRQIGRQIKNFAGTVQFSQKLNPYDLLTKVDTEVENMIKAKLAELDPGTPVVGEETGGDRTQSRYWLIDPIDGTIHFTRGLPFFSIMVALVENNIPIVGIIYNISTDEFFSAVKGTGARKEGNNLHISSRDISQAVILTEINLRKQENMAKYCALASKVKTMNLICAGYEFAMVAEGKADARICIDPYGNDYDFAAGTLIVQEAGGIVKTLDGEDYNLTKKDFIVASSLEMYYRIVDILKESEDSNEKTL